MPALSPDELPAASLSEAVWRAWAGTTSCSGAPRQAGCSFTSSCWLTPVEPRQLERIDPDGHCHWRAMPADREREKRRVLDEMGAAAGIGPKP
jgi:hypothetical protein